MEGEEEIKKLLDELHEKHKQQQEIGAKAKFTTLMYEELVKGCEDKMKNISEMIDRLRSIDFSEGNPEVEEGSSSVPRYRKIIHKLKNIRKKINK